VRWRAYVTGDKVDLGILRDLFPPAHDPSYGEDETGAFFQSSALEGFVASGTDERQQVEELITLINGTASALHPTFRPVVPGPCSDDEGRSMQVTGSGHMEFRAGTGESGVVSGPAVSAAIPASDFVALAQTHADVARVQRWLAQPEPGWETLYKIYEIIAGAVGGESVIQSRGWASGKALGRFTASANDPALSGEPARHAVSPKGSPRGGKLQLSIDEARGLIRGVARDWMASLV
jgi:hypothetical protein